MTDFHINTYVFLGILEFALLLLVLSLVFILRSHKLAGRLRVAQVKLKKAAQLPEPVTFDQYLRDELSQNQDILERVAASQDEAEKKVADLMDIRNFGSKSIDEVKDKLLSLGLALKDSPAGFVPAYVEDEDGDFVEDEQL